MSKERILALIMILMSLEVLGLIRIPNNISMESKESFSLGLGGWVEEEAN